MNDELERLRREVETLTAERDRLRGELLLLKADYHDVLVRLSIKEWEGVTQADLDEALASGDTISSLIARLEHGDQLAPDDAILVATS